MQFLGVPLRLTRAGNINFRSFIFGRLEAKKESKGYWFFWRGELLRHETQKDATFKRHLVAVYASEFTTREITSTRFLLLFPLLSVCVKMDFTERITNRKKKGVRVGVKSKSNGTQVSMEMNAAEWSISLSLSLTLTH